MKDLIYDKLGAVGLKIVNNYGSEQLVKHYHVHVIPVYEGTDFHYIYADENDIITDAHYGVHVVGVDDGRHAELLCNTVQQVIDDE